MHHRTQGVGDDLLVVGELIDRGGAAPRVPPLRVVATACVLVAGLSLAAYALTGFTTRDWTVAGPALAVAGAGIAGMRQRWFHLAGLIPIGAVVTVAAPILAYDLARPGETPYFIGSVAIIVGACAAAAFGVASTTDDRRAGLAATAVSLVVTPLVFLIVVASNPASADPGDGITEAERAAAVDVEMIDVAFVVDQTALRPGAVVHLRNSGALPHDFTIAALDVAVYVPPGRDTHLRLPDAPVETFAVICTVGDHLERGMRLDVTLD